MKVAGDWSHVTYQITDIPQSSTDIYEERLKLMNQLCEGAVDKVN